MWLSGRGTRAGEGGGAWRARRGHDLGRGGCAWRGHRRPPSTLPAACGLTRGVQAGVKVPSVSSNNKSSQCEFERSRRGPVRVSRYEIFDRYLMTMMSSAGRLFSSWERRPTPYAHAMRPYERSFSRQSPCQRAAAQAQGAHARGQAKPQGQYECKQ